MEKKRAERRCERGRITVHANAADKACHTKKGPYLERYFEVWYLESADSDVSGEEEWYGAAVVVVVVVATGTEKEKEKETEKEKERRSKVRIKTKEFIVI